MKNMRKKKNRFNGGGKHNNSSRNQDNSGSSTTRRQSPPIICNNNMSVTLPSFASSERIVIFNKPFSIFIAIIVAISWQSLSRWGQFFHFSKLVFQNTVGGSIINNYNYYDIQNSSGRNEDDNIKIEVFLKWLKDNGANISPSITVASFPEFGGYGLQAKKVHHQSENVNNINNNHDSDDNGNEKIAVHHLDEMFTIPQSIIISSESIRKEYQSSIPQFQSKLSHLLNQFVQLNAQMVQQDVIIALFLMVQCSLKEQSSFHPYLDILPAYVIPRLDTFTDEELDMLLDDNLKDLAKKSYNQLHSLWENEQLHTLLLSMINIAQSANNNHSTKKNVKSNVNVPVDNNQGLSQCLSFQSFHKYVAIVSSRAMVLQGTKYLTPLAEFANYHPRNDEDKFIKSRSGQSFTLYHEKNKDGSITVRADRDIVYGEQIFEDYGDIDNSLYLEAHGFVPDKNPFHCAMIPSELIPSPKAIPTVLRQALVRLKILPQKDSELYPSPSVCVLNDGSILDTGVEAYLTIIAIERAESQKIVEKCSAALDTDDDELVQLQCLHYDGHKQLLHDFIKILAFQTSCQSSSSLKDDEEMLSSLLESHSFASDHTKKILALKFRMSDAKIFHNIVGANNDGIDCSSIKNKDINKSLYAGSSNPQSSKSALIKTELETSIILERFNSFIDNLGMPIRKVEAKFVGDGMRIGVIATENIEEGDIYLSVNSSSVIDIDTALVAKNGKVVKILEYHGISPRNGGFEAILLFLLHEKFVSKEQSKWHPYLEVLPSVDEMKRSSPLFFDDILFDYAAGSDLRTMLRNNKRKATDLFISMSMNKDVLKFLGPNTLKRDNFFWAYSIIDQRSIWWNGKRHLVPLLDLVNCMEQYNQSGNITSVHQTILDKSKHAITKASKVYKKGEQLFENYGQPNHIYFVYHGFGLENNSHDCAHWSGLGINYNDKGAQNMTETRMSLSKYGFTSMDPSFCLHDYSSLVKVAQFLKIKYGLESNNDDDTGITSTVLPYLSQHLYDRYRRYSQSRRVIDGTNVTLPEAAKAMVKIVTKEMHYFEAALESIMTAK